MDGDDLSAGRLKAYATLIAETFSKRLNTMSETGIALEFGLRQTQQLSRTIAETAAGGSGPEGDGRGEKNPAERPVRTESADDLDHLIKWAANGPDRPPLLVTAPFGFGKSALLGRLTADLARKAIAILARRRGRGADDPALRIPLPVRLRDAIKGQDWQQVLAGAIESFAQGSGPEQRLTVEQIKKLNGRGQLVCLYDGHDELGEALGADVLAAIRRFHGSRDGYVISSREVVHGFAPEQRYQLRELDDGSIQVVMDAKLSKRADRAAIQDRFDELEPAISGLLRRPLFLAAWVDEAAVCADAGKLPKDIHGLMELVTVKSFGRARLTLPDCPQKRDDQIKTFPSLGYYLLADAEASYDEKPRNEIARQALIDKRLGTQGIAPAGYAPERTRDLAEALGILSRGPTGESWAGKIPVTEFLVGAYMADLAAGEEAQQRAFAEVVRRWCYRPRTYDTLDCAVYRLVHFYGKTELLHGLIEWMTKASDQEPYRAAKEQREVSPPVADCLVRPAAWLAVRWVDRMKGEIGQELAVAAGRSLIRHGQGEILWPPGTRHSTVGGLIREWIASYANAREEDKDAWARTIEGAAGRVEEKLAPTVVREFIASYANAREEDKDAWTLAIQGAAGRVEEKLAPTVVREFIASYANAREEDKDAWARAIRGAAGRVEEKLAPTVVRELIASYANARKEDKYAWARAIQGAAGRVEEKLAPTVVRELIASYANARKEDKYAWALAIEGAAGRVEEKLAPTVVRELIASYANAREEDKYAWARAIYGAAGRVEEKLAPTVVREFIASYANAREEDKDAWARAIEGAAGRVEEKLAPTVVRELIASYANARKEDKYAWTWAIEGAAGRVEEKLAPTVVRELIASYANARKEDKYAWARAIQGAAGRVEEKLAPTVVRELIASYANARKEDKYAWARAIQGAAGRVEIAENTLSMIQTLLNDGRQELAIEVASKADSVGLLAAVGEEVDQGLKPTGKIAWDGKTLIPVLREDDLLVLDLRGSVTPPAIKRLLDGSLPLTDKERRILKALRDNGPHTTRGGKKQYVWCSWNYIVAEKIRSNAGQSGYPRTLVSPLIERGLVEEQGTKYRLTEEGFRLLEQG